MAKSGFQSLLVLAVALVLSNAQTVPCPYDVCKCTDENIDCTNLGLTQLPPLKPGTFPQHDLDISNNKITAINDGELPNNLQDITSRGNPLATISDHAFQGSAYSLKNLILDNGAFTELPKAIDELDSLSFLGIRRSALKSIPPGPEILPNLYYIDFSHNQIDDISNIGRLKHSLLTRLDLPYNQISDISSVGQLDSLRTLNVYSNKICDHDQVNQVIIPHQDTLNNLNLGRNCLTAIPNLSGLTALTRLLLKENQIMDCDKGSFPPLLQTLILQKNRLPCVPKAILGLQNVTVLMLWSNEIQSVDNFVFPSSISSLQLYNNQITNITKLEFENSISNINYLDLHNNPNLQYIGPDAFATMTNMTNLYLQDLPLGRLPLALKGLPNLQELHLENNPNLQCTCSEAALEGWYGMSTPKITGTCGGNDIAGFLANTQCNVVG